MCPSNAMRREDAGVAAAESVTSSTRGRGTGRRQGRGLWAEAAARALAFTPMRREPWVLLSGRASCDGFSQGPSACRVGDRLVGPGGSRETGRWLLEPSG